MSTIEERLAKLKSSVSGYEPSAGPIEHCTSLRLQESWDTSLPEGLFDLTGLKKIHSFESYYSSLTSNISKLTSLESISFARNQLQTLPQEISLLTGLTYLGLADNPIEELPLEITALTNLKSLGLYNNMGRMNVKRVPRGITALPCWNESSDRSGTLSDAVSAGKLTFFD